MHNIDKVDKSNRFPIINNQVRGHCFKYFKEISRQQYRENFFFNRAANLWNALPSQIVQAPTINKEIIAKSFDLTGITQNDEALYHEALRQILEACELPATLLQHLDGTENFDEMFIDDDTPLSDTETIDDDDSDNASG